MYDTRDINLMKDTLVRYEHLVQRPYLHELSCLPSAAPTFCHEPIWLLQIKSLSDTATYHEFSYILNALAALDQTIGCILISSGGKLSLYIALKGDCPFSLSLLQNGLLQTFPDSTCCPIEQASDFLDDLFDPQNYSCLTSSLAVPNSTYSPLLLSRFTKLMGTHSDYIAFFLAQPINRTKLINRLNELYDIHDILFNFSEIHYTNYKSDSKTVTNSTAEGCSNTSSKSTTDTCSEGNACSHNSYINVSASTPLTLIAHKARAADRPANLPSHEISKKTLEKPLSSDPTHKNINATVLFNTAKGTSSNSSSSKAHGHICGDSNSLTSTRGHSMCHTNYQAFNFCSRNKYIQDAISFLTHAIARYNTLSTHASFCFSSYFFSPCSETSIRAGHSYAGLTQSSYILSPNVVNYWSNQNAEYEYIYRCLRHFVHPEFFLSNTNLTVAGTTPILGNELINSIYLPLT